MKRFVEGEDRRQGVLLPEYLDDYVSQENPVRVIDVFVNELDLGALGFAGVVPEETGRQAYHPGVLLKIYVYGYINQIASSRRLEREAHGGYRDASLQAPADGLVLGRASDGHAFQRNVGTAVGRSTRPHLQDRLAADTEAAAIDGRS